MNLIIFITLALVLVVLAVGFILHTLLKVDANKNYNLEKEREADNVAHLKKQLNDLINKLNAGEITETEFEQYKLDAERRLLHNIKPSVKQDQGSPIALIIIICTALPVLSLLLYIGLGTPIALDAEAKKAQQITHKQPRTIEQAFAELKERLQKDPQDIEAKFALGRLYYANNQFTDALKVFKELFNEQPDRPDILIAYAEALARTQNNFFRGEPLKLIKRTLQLDPQHKKANWLLGVAAFQENNTSEAISIWQKQLARSDNSDREKQMLEQMIAQAGGQVDNKSAFNDDSAHLTITASISEKLKGKYKGSDSVFIYAKAASGPAMPLAIHRTTADKLPLTLTLTDADAMTPQMKLSMFAEVVAIARISKSGDAITQSGDLQGQSEALSNNQSISIEINTIIP